MKTQNKKNIALVAGLINPLLFLIMIGVNALANILPINGISTGEVSDKYATLFAPAGFTFAIWGVIYILLLFFVLYGIFAVFSKKENNALDLSAYIAFALSCLLNTLWIWAWHYEKLAFTVIIMLLLLLVLIFLFLKTERLQGYFLIYKIAVRIPISVYLAWISVALIANISAYIVAVTSVGAVLPERFWAVVVIVVSAVLGLLMIWRKNNIVYSLVLIWAYWGIISKRQAQEIVYTDIIYAAYMAMAVLILTAIVKTIHRQKLLLR